MGYGGGTGVGGDIIESGRLAYGAVLREQIRNNGKVFINVDDSTNLIGELKFGYVKENDTFCELSEYDTEHPSEVLKGRPGYFVLGEANILQIPLCKIEGYKFSPLPVSGSDLLELKINNSLPPRKQRNHLRWNN